MSKLILYALNFIRRDIWLMDTTKLSSHKQKLIFTLRRLYLSVLQYQEVNCSIWAYSLTTITLISLIPILAFSFSIVKGFGGHKSIHSQYIEPSLDRWLGEREAPELRNLADQIVVFVEDTDLSSLGVAGLVVVLFAVIRLLGSVESVFNALWKIRKPRSLVRKLTDYLGVVVTIPIVLFIVIPTLTSFQITQVTEYPIFSKWVVSFFIFCIVWFGFTLMYQIMPNAQIRLRSSMNGGFLGGILWILVYYAHIKLQVGVASYNALYAGFSAVPIFIGWVYFSWSSILIGAAFAASIQIEEEHKSTVIRKNLDFLRREELALMLVLELARSFCAQKGPMSLSELGDTLKEEEAALSVVLKDLESSGILVKTEKGSYILCRDPQYIDVFVILESMKEQVRDIEKTISFLDAFSEDFVSPENSKEDNATEQNNQQNIEPKTYLPPHSVLMQKFIEIQILQYLQQARGTKANLNVTHLLEEFQEQRNHLESIVQEHVEQSQVSQGEKKEGISPSSGVVVTGI